MYPEVVFEKVLYGDNQSALSIIEKPDGPWRTRHLRLRANVLKEKMRNEALKWCVRYQKGTDLIADLLTKPICQLGSWVRFRVFMDFYVPDSGDVVVGEAANDEKKSSAVVVGEAANDEKKSSAVVVGEAVNDENAKCTAGVDEQLKAKIAKVGIVMSVLGAIPPKAKIVGWNETSKGILLVVLTVVLLTWIVQLLRMVHGSKDNGEKVSLCRLKMSTLGCSQALENQKNKINKEEEIERKNHKRARIKEPAPKENGTRENEPVPGNDQNEQKEDGRNNGCCVGRSTRVRTFSGRQEALVTGEVVGESLVAVDFTDQAKVSFCRRCVIPLPYGLPLTRRNTGRLPWPHP